MSSYSRLDAQTANMAFDSILVTHAEAWRETLVARRLWAPLTEAAAAVRSRATATGPGVAVRRPSGQTLLVLMQAQDVVGGLIGGLLEAVVTDPAAPAALIASVQNIEAGLGLQRLRVARRLADRVAVAQRLRRDVPAFESALRGLVSATGQSALTLVDRWLTATDSMVALHETMALLPAPTGPSLNSARVLLADARRQLVNEVELRSELPRDLVNVVFGTTDDAARSLARQARRSRVRRLDAAPAGAASSERPVSVSDSDAEAAG